MSSNDAELPSVAVFSPQSKAPKQDYLNELRSYLCKNEQLQPFVHAIKDLSHTWSIFANSRGDVAALSQGPRYTQALSDWIATGESAPISNVMSGILSLPLLTIIQVTQYFQFLELRNVRHHEFMAHLRSRGGVQGYCGGLMPAIAIACSADESELVVNASKAMRIALGVGAYGELGDDENETGPTTMVIRLKQEGQGEEIIKKFPGVSKVSSTRLSRGETIMLRSSGIYLRHHRPKNDQCRRSIPYTGKSPVLRRRPGNDYSGNASTRQGSQSREC